MVCKLGRGDSNNDPVLIVGNGVGSRAKHVKTSPRVNEEKCAKEYSVSPPLADESCARILSKVRIM